MKKFLIGILIFIVLNLYFNFTTHFISNTVIVFISILLFFPLASYLVRLVGISGLRGLGLFYSKRGLRFFCISFLIGFGTWTLMYLLYSYLGKFQIMGVKTGIEALWIVLQVLVGFFLGSLINDLITRSYVIHFLQGKMQPVVIGFISIVIYALDDFWNGDLTLMNFVFSLILGCTFTLAFLKTGSLWANTGLHFGLNIAFGLFYGLNGTYGSGLITTVEGEIHWAVNSLIVLGAACVLFVIVYFVYQKPKAERKEEAHVV
jgi:membrane protease YdiL (CAAX protease family)